MAGRILGGVDPGKRPDRAAGDFRSIYEDHVRYVWRVLARLGVLESDVPDAVQDVFIVVHRRLAEFEGRSKVSTWLFGICARVASQRRQRVHHRREVSVERLSLGADPAPDGAAATERSRAREVFEIIVGRMPEEQRIVFVLFEVEGMSGEAIAEALEVPIGTVRSRLRLARAAFDEAVARLQARDAGPRAALRPREI